MTYLWYLFTWVVTLSFVVVTYHFIGESPLFQFQPSTWTLIDRIYIALKCLLTTAIVANITGLILREIKQSLAHENMFIRKFLPTIRFMVLLLIWIIGGFILLEKLRINTSGLLAGAGIGGAIFALASKDIIANLLGSISIIMSKTFEIGDTIRVKGIEGIVEEITLNHTKIMDTTGKVVYIPNRILNSEQLENLTRRRFFVYTYRVPFKKTGNDPEAIKDTLMFIEGKISEYAPIGIDIRTEIPNANDFVYIYDVKIPEQNDEFDREIREFLIPYIFPKA